MNNIILKEEDDSIVFYNKNDNSEIYDIPITQINETRIDNGNILSVWVLHLLENSWSYPDLLYQLAKIIQDKFPQNNIHWDKTFLIVEMEDYLDKYSDLNDEINQKEKSDFESLKNRIKAGKEDIPESKEYLQGLVLRNLKKYSIIN